MHAFDYRLIQLLDRVAELTPARRQRLARSLRQDDVELGVRAGEPSLDAAMKAALRVAAHEVLDAFCVHLEGALAQCRNDHVRALLMGVAAIVLAEHGCVLFAANGAAAGIEFPAAETVVLASSPAIGVDLEISRRTAAGRAARALLVSVGIAPETTDGRIDVLTISAESIDADPFLEASRVLKGARAASGITCEA